MLFTPPSTHNLTVSIKSIIVLLDPLGLKKCSGVLMSPPLEVQGT